MNDQPPTSGTAGSPHHPDLDWVADRMTSGYGHGRLSFPEALTGRGGELPWADSPVTGAALGGLITSLRRAWASTGLPGTFPEWTPEHSYRIPTDVNAAFARALRHLHASA